ncbi:hypothetical protein [Halorubrum distributum]|uniref:hypothetical protein n=1 Tax=Halorubrum distributum TaxID=29283 RepID=UPI001268AF31|nr:hypothetical protein [Halorubrum arcis]
MTKYLALWYIATTLLLLNNALSRRSVIALGLVVGLIAIGGYKLKKIQSDQKIVIATVSLAAVILAGLVIPIGVAELSRNFTFQDQFVLSVSALGIVVVLGTAIELTKRIRAAEA